MLSLSFVAASAGGIKYPNTDSMTPLKQPTPPASPIIPSHELSNTVDNTTEEDIDSVTSLQQSAPENLLISESRRSSNASEKYVNGKVKFERVCILVNLSKNVI